MNTNETKLFVNGKFYLDEQTTASNLVVKDGKVIASDVNINEYPDAVVTDLQGGFAYPGFNDSHVHPLEVGMVMDGVDLRGCATSDEIAQKISDFLKTYTSNDPLFGNGFYPKDYLSWSLDDLKKIDDVTGDRPAMMFDELGHNCVINSALIKESGITADTPVPMGGKVVVQDGKPTGMLCESAMTLASPHIFPLYPDAKIRIGVQKLLNLWASMGYTGIVDLMGAPFGRIIKPEILRAMETDNTLPVRVNFMYTFFNRDEIDNALAYKGHDTEMVRFGGLKIFIDGAYAAGQAYTTEENLKGDHGLFYVSTDDSHGEEFNIYRIIEKINDVGLNVHYHVQGDKAIEVVLDGIQKAKEKTGKLTSTHTLIHLAFPTPEQIERIKGFDGHVVTTVQPGFWSVEDDTVKYYGDKAKRCYPVKQLIDAGISVGMSTDFSVSPISLAAPTTIMGIAAQGAGEPENHPPLTIASMIKGFSAGSAATTTTGHETGKLHQGYKADFVVYDKDLFDVPFDELKADNPKVVSTWINGNQMFGK